MSESLITLTKFGPDAGASIDSRTVDYYFIAEVGAGTYPEGGLALSFAGQVAAPGAPLKVDIWSAASPNSGWDYRYNPGAVASPYSPASQTSGLFQVFGNGAAQYDAKSEIQAGNTPSTVIADTIYVRATFLRG
jgi:hypothetical protein